MVYLSLSAEKSKGLTLVFPGSGAPINLMNQITKVYSPLALNAHCEQGDILPL